LAAELIGDTIKEETNVVNGAENSLELQTGSSNTYPSGYQGGTHDQADDQAC